MVKAVLPIRLWNSVLALKNITTKTTPPPPHMTTCFENVYVGAGNISGAESFDIWKDDYVVIPIVFLVLNKVLMFETTSSRSALLVELSTAGHQGFCNSHRILFSISITSDSWLSFLKMSLASLKRIVYCHHTKKIWLTLDLPPVESSFIVIQLL